MGTPRTGGVEAQRDEGSKASARERACVQPCSSGVKPPLSQLFSSGCSKALTAAGSLARLLARSDQGDSFDF